MCCGINSCSIYIIFRWNLFLANESSDVTPINKSFGEEIKDGAIFELDGETMGAVIKEIDGHTMLVSSREDN